ncbi:MAG: aromatic acid decarboxylase [Aquificaceae bacterium]|nr:MAG: aromatic acid decarboxylase [Aquificaceae bacterium]
MPSVVLCITGASGSLYAQTFLELAISLKINVDCIVSERGQKVLEYELGIPFNKFKKHFEEGGVKFHPPQDFFSPLASGSVLNRYNGVVVLPCSVGTLGAVANGISSNLVHRVCDVALKERIPLVMAVREMPLNAIHLENMLKLQKMGAVAFVISPAFYNKPKDIKDLALFVVGRIFDLLGIKTEIYKRWKED